MSDTILGGDFTVYYEAENRQKRIKWTGAATATRTANELYSALQDLFDELTQMDDGIPMSAQTPTEYTIGIIDAGDDDPWFIDRDSVEHVTGGAIKTASWARIQDSNTGIVRVTCSGVFNIVEGDIGYDITHTQDGDSGTLLDVNVTSKICWIRPDSDVAANNFDSATGQLICNAHSAAQDGAAVTGESLWANIYSLGTIETNTHLYIYQNAAKLVAYKGTEDWWSDGHIDVLICIKEVGTEIDEAVIQVLGRQYSKTCDYYEVDLTAGGRNPIPLATADDLNNETGYRQMVLTDSAGTFTVGEIIEDDTDATIQGIVTAVSGTNPDVTLQYYLMGDPLTDFSSSTGTFAGEGTGAGTAVDPTNVGPAALAGLSIVHAADETFDIDENGTTENYSIVIDCSDEALSDVYEWTKYITRRGDTNTGNTDGQKGEEYIGSDRRIIYTTMSGTVNEGDDVYQDITAAKGVVVALNTTDKICILRSSRGTFNNSDIIRKDGTNYLTGPTSTVLSPVKADPYGNFAGGVFFCAPGVVLDNVPSADLNNFQLVDDNGNSVEAPTKVTVEVGNTRLGDRIAVFRLTAGGNIEKDTYTVDTVGSIGDTSISVDPNIDPEEPGKTTGGILRLVDVDADVEYRYRYASWTGDDFTLFNEAADVAEATTDEDTIKATGGFTNCKVGDIIYNSSRTAVTYIKSVTSDDEVEVAPAVTSQASGDNFRVGALVADITTSDKVYVPFIDVYETAGTPGSPGSESVSVTYSVDISVRVRARQAGDIVPFTADSTIASTGMTLNVIRTEDTIYS